MSNIIPFYVPPEQDEDLTSWTRYLATINHMNERQFMKRFFLYDIGTERKDFLIRNLSQITERYHKMGFPAMRELVYRHSDVMAQAPLTHPYRTIQRIQIMLNGTTSFGNWKVRERQRTYFCPECAKEDLERIGRIIVHVPHQMPGVMACYKHGILLQDSPDIQTCIPATGDQVLVATFLHDLYELRPYGSIDDTIDMLKDVDEPLVRKFGFRSIKEYLSKIRKIKNGGGSCTAILPVISQRFRAYDITKRVIKDEKKEIAACEQLLEEYAPSLTVAEWDFPFAKILCGKCGNTSILYYDSIRKLPLCQYCMDSLSPEEQIKELVRVRTRGEFLLKEIQSNKTATISHKCGNDIHSSYLYNLILSGKLECPECRSHLGEGILMRSGIYARIVRYGGCNDIDVEFSDGTLRKGVTYHQFKERTLLSGKRIPTSHIGEEAVMHCGLLARIVRYDGYRDIDVEFSDGTLRKGATYYQFKNRTLLSGKRIRTSRIGEEAVMNSGLRARIVRYGGYKDIDVEFSDGTLRKGVTYHQFKEWTLMPDKKIRTSHIGEEAVMNSGLHARIVRYGGCNDIDVEFSDGTLRKGVTYYQFKERTLLSGKRIRTSRIGEEAVMNSGLHARIVRYNGCKDIDVEFSDGSLRKGVTYQQFKERTLLPVKRESTSHKGEEAVMHCGLRARIVRYGGYKDIDVEFSDGTLRKGVTYHQFKNRTLLPVKRIHTSHIGEEAVMNSGLHARIVRYDGCKDIDVEFSDGSLRKGVTYQQFKERTLLPVKRESTSHKGEEAVMHCGLRAWIVRYGGYNDIDVEFSDGSLRKGVTYQQFKCRSLLPVKKSGKGRAESEKSAS